MLLILLLTKNCRLLQSVSKSSKLNQNFKNILNSSKSQIQHAKCQIKLLTPSYLAISTPPYKNSPERKDFQKFYDIQLSIAEQTKKFYEKSPNILGKQKSLPQINAAFTQQKPQNPSQPAYNHAKPLQQYQKERNKPFHQIESFRPQYSQQTTYQPTS